MTIESNVTARPLPSAAFERRWATGLLPLLAAILATALSTGTARGATDLDGLRDGLCDAEIVLLGELPTHGESRAFVMKAELADALIEHCGFDALLFEAPFYEFAFLEPRFETGEARPEQLDNAIGGFWNGPLLADWRRRWFDLASSGRLQLGGIDDQFSASSVLTRAQLPDRVAARLLPDRQAGCRQSLERHLFWQYDDRHPFDAAEREALAACAQAALDGWADADQEDARDARHRATFEALRSLFGRQAGEAAFANRGRSMFERLAGFRAQSPERKLIVWTATVHAIKQASGLPHRSVGDFARERWGGAVMSVGWTAASGEGARAGGVVYPIAPAAEGSLEQRALENASDADRVVLDREALEGLGAVESGLLGAVRTLDWNEAFDFVVVIREEAPP